MTISFQNIFSKRFTTRQTEQLSVRERTRRISKLIRYAEKRLKRRFPVLRHQNAIGMGIFLFSVAAMVATSSAYIAGLLPIWATIVINAILASILHELEHDLIHSLYFKDKWQEKFMMWGVWIFRGNTPSPFYRKKIHLLHHKESGQVTDIEEQLIGNGMKWGLKRLIVMLDQNLAFIMRARKVARTAPELNLHEMMASAMPIQVLFTLLGNVFVVGNLLTLGTAALGFQVPAFLISFMAVVNVIAVIYVIPNFIRQGSIQIISSNMHYFGDIAAGKDGLIQQTQVLTPWYLLPFQLFCFNFGSTHGIHHFVANQPFYHRQLITPIAHRAMYKYGVRFNDMGTFERANRWETAAAA